MSVFFCACVCVCTLLLMSVRACLNPGLAEQAPVASLVCADVQRLGPKDKPMDIQSDGPARSPLKEEANRGCVGLSVLEGIPFFGLVLTGKPKRRSNKSLLVGPTLKQTPPFFFCERRAHDFLFARSSAPEREVQAFTQQMEMERKVHDHRRSLLLSDLRDQKRMKVETNIPFKAPSFNHGQFSIER